MNVRSIVWALGLTQIIGYGTLYYSFGALAPSMADTFGWPQAWVYGVLSMSLLIGGLAAPLSGKLADRHGAGNVMAWGSVAAALSLVLCALAPDGYVFVLGLVAVEIASAFVLYATAFVALTQAAPHAAQRTITHLTLIAGFASTVFWPLTSYLHQHLSWQNVYLVYAALNVLVALPVHIWLARTVRERQRQPISVAAQPVLPLVQGERQRAAMLLMLLAFALLGFVSSAIAVHLLPMLEALGAGGSALVVTMLFGPSQVLSRLINLQWGRNLLPPVLAVVAACLMLCGLALLVITAPWALGAAGFAILFGFGNGLLSIVSGTLPLALFGTANYGQRLGWISSARLIASAAAPFAFALMAQGSSTATALWAVNLVGLSAAAAFGLIWWQFGRTAPVPRALPAESG